MPSATLEPPITVITAPLDQGVRNVGGRPGASEGPERLIAELDDRDALPSSTEILRPTVENAPDTLEADLSAISDAVERVLADERTPLVLGGDHGTTYATVRGAARALGPLGVAYLDVHLDMRAYRPVHTSGSSFRRLVEEGCVDPARLLPVGIETPATAEARERSSFDELAAWADTHGVDWIPLDEARQRGPGTILAGSMRPGPWCLSLDVDVIDERWAPGVSAPGTDRMTPGEVRSALEIACPRSRVMDVAEYAPPLDEGDRTLSTVADLIGAILPS